MCYEEITCSSNLAFATYPLLTAGAAAALCAHASDEQIGRYVPRLASGEWSGTMCLTEPQAGTDLGLLTTRAEPDPSTVATGSPAPRSSSPPVSTT